ncbi:uncharacterized protein PGTG_10307 [Puccinia graminis f. sp. tritici CRL 75-36-700-3]|uniref:CxC1-like cysteine cluster associated with KDZ transposases domain-containing protein n=2 Tax=Puccinia graminis f. sp. tritici TaxID=56615 RepID=E3KKL1_PUCGT|nr:uncharacterized protein PGTG_10307 [Puccinia graminis f. sp. tritici CRL 75-36-700-3]EFP84836.2 hypothetical protein PGTG_10307 [Puccinia graminis f. sp. tritici CRL 75-36-700-3]
MPLLSSHNQLIKHSMVGNLPSSTQVWLEAKLPALLSPSGKRPRFRRQFPPSFEMYQMLLNRVEDNPKVIPKLTEQQALGLVSCPVCAGRAARENKNTSGYNVINPLLVVCPEGNIQDRFHFETDKNYFSRATLSKSVKPEEANQPSTPAVQA